MRRQASDKMASPQWKAFPKVDVARDNLIDAFCHCDCFGRVGSGCSILDIQLSQGPSLSSQHLASH
eukprot:4633230-Pyramimonas_sp.AAC.1